METVKEAVEHLPETVKEAVDAVEHAADAGQFELTLFGKGAIAVGSVACLVELANASGVKLEEQSPNAQMWRSFTWRFAIGLLCLRIWVFFASRLGAHIAAKSSSFLTDFILSPATTVRAKKLRTLGITRFMVDQNLQPGGRWGIDLQLLELLKDEGDGFSACVWIFAVALLAALCSGVPFVQNMIWVYEVVLALLTWRFAVLLCRSLEIVSHTLLEQKFLPTDDGSVRHAVRFLNVLIGILSVLFVGANWGCDVSAALTGLGITSILVGLSSQTILTDMFAWLVLISQKPFVTGDYVSLCGHAGTVEKINFLTTWLRLPPGESVVLRNKNVTDKHIVNYQHMPNKRYDLDFEVSGLCSPDLLAEVKNLARDAVEKQARCKFSNCWMEGVVPFGFKFIYQFEAAIPDVQEARDASTEIWLRLLCSFKEKGIVLASTDRLQRGLLCQES